MRRFQLAAPTLLLVLSACGGDKATGPNNNGGTSATGSMSARVDGAVWNATLPIQVINQPASGQVPALISIGGSSLTAGITFAFTAAGTGTYTTAGNVGTIFLLFEGFTGKMWGAIASTAGSTGTVTLTTLTSTRAVGTFSFTAVATASSGATGTRVVTNGVFDVTF